MIEMSAKNREITTPTSTTPPQPQNPRYSIVSYLATGLNPEKIRRKLNIPPSTFQYHLSILKRQGYIHKVGYGTWEVLKPLEQEKKTTAGSGYVGTPRHPPSRGSSRGSPAVLTQSVLSQFQQDAIRAHAFVTTWQVPTALRNWTNEKRIQYLEAHHIPYKPLGIGGGGQRIIVKDRKVWLTNKSIIIYDKASYFADAALPAKSTAIATHLSIVKRIERLLHTSLEIGSDHKFKVSRQHYAMIQNALAEQYNEAGEKLEVRNGRGLWFLIDNSFNLNEAEAVHPSSSMSDADKVQDFFNSLKDKPLTTDFILTAMAGIQENQAAFAENMASHISAIQDLGAGVREMNKLLQQLKEQL